MGLFDALFKTVPDVTDEEIRNTFTVKLLLKYCDLLIKLQEERHCGYGCDKIRIYPCMMDGEIEYNRPEGLFVHGFGDFVHSWDGENINDTFSYFLQGYAEEGSEPPSIMREWDDAHCFSVRDENIVESRPVIFELSCKSCLSRYIRVLAAELRQRGLDVSDNNGKNITVTLVEY